MWDGAHGKEFVGFDGGSMNAHLIVGKYTGLGCSYAQHCARLVKAT